MIPRILEKDVRVVLQKLEKLPLDQIRNLTKDFGSTKDNEGPDNTNCKKCEQILAKLFTAQDSRPAVYATSAKNDGEKLEQKLETIKERPLVETESGSQGLEFQPKILGQIIHRPPDIQWRRKNIEDAALNEIARRLIGSTPQDIDRRILEAYNLSTADINQVEEGELNLISVNNPAAHTCRSDNVLFDVIDSTFPGSNQEYSVDIIDETSNRIMEVERPHPANYDTEYATYIEKGTMRRKVLRDLEDLGVALVPQSEMMMVPLPPNLTAISSYDVLSPNLEINEEDDNNNSTSISSHTLSRKMKHSFRKDRTIMDEHVTYFSTLSSSTPINKRSQIDKRQDLDSVPLSVLLKWARQRSMEEKETKKDHVWKGTRYLSKGGGCLPPLDFRPRSKTCPPRPCSPTKRKKTPCPPRKNPCPPPKKKPCPPPKSPCDPCKQPPGCPPKQKPCKFIIGNRIKETISLILSAYEPLSPLPLLPSPKEKCSMTTVALCHTLPAEIPLPGLKRLDDHVDSKCSLLVEPGKLESVALSRSFDPWTPIPSWPIPQKKAEKRLICPKEGCPPPKPPKNPCKEQPCDVSKRHKFTEDSNLYC